MWRSVMFSLLPWLCPEHKVSHADTICTTLECCRTAEMFQNAMDSTVEPCTNFYNHVCGKYENLELTKIPPHNWHYSPYYFHDELIKKKILDYIQTINTGSPKGFQNVRTFYELCMNDDQRRAMGYNTLQDELDIIGMNLLPPFHSEAEPGKDYATIIGKIHRFSSELGSKFLYHVSLHNYQSVLFIGSIRDNVPLDVRDKFIASLREFMVSVIYHLYEYSNFKLTEEMKRKIEQRVNDVLELGVALTQILISSKAEGSPQPLYSGYVMQSPCQIRTTINELLGGGEIQMDFINYLLTLFKEDSKLPGQSLIEKKLVKEKNYRPSIKLYYLNEFKETFRILRRTNQSVFESYMWWSVVESILNEGPAELYKYHQRYMKKLSETLGYLPPKPRDEECWLQLKTYFGNFIGHVLAKTSNGKKKKEQVNEMFKFIKKSYKESIRRTHWADNKTKKMALKKIQSMKIYAGFDDSLLKIEIIDREYGKIDVQPGNFYKYLESLYRKTREKRLFNIFTTFDFNKKIEFNPADVIGAHFIHNYNSIVIPLTVIEFPLYDLGLEVLNYGIMGHTIAHEVGHALDNNGIKYDAKGNYRSIMTKKSLEAFTRIEQCFIEEWNRLIISTEEGIIRVNGAASLNENMADWNGFNMAMMAYKKFEEKYGIEQKLVSFENFSPGKLFSLAYASTLCINATSHYIRNAATKSKHAPEQTRVNGIVRNLRQFSDVWGCPKSSPMNPPDKCEVWF